MGAQALLRASSARLGRGRRLLAGGALLRVVEDGGVEPLLVAEVVVRGGDVGARAPADLRDGGAAESVAANTSAAASSSRWRVRADRGLAVISNEHLK